MLWYCALALVIHLIGFGKPLLRAGKHRVQHLKMSQKSKEATSTLEHRGHQAKELEQDTKNALHTIKTIGNEVIAILCRSTKVTYSGHCKHP